MTNQTMRASGPGKQGTAAWRPLLSTLFAGALLYGAPSVRAGEAAAPAASQATAPGTAQMLCDALLQVMKQGSTLDFAGRVKLLDPILRKLYDMPLVTRLVVGAPWRAMSPDEQQQVVQAFSDYSVAVYAGRFKSFSGEKFVVDPAASTLPSGDAIAHTKLYPHDSDVVQLDYLERQESGSWRIIDVLLSGTISEMAERRSEYASAVRDGGATALVKLLRDKTAELAAKH